MATIRVTSAWQPVASSTDLTPRHVYQGQLHGRELAIWRADDGYVNVWENRCLHRGVRLSIAVNDGRELQCQYHGWRYSNRTAACTYIPAHPADAPARTIRNRTYSAIERYGLVWACLEDDRPDDIPQLPYPPHQLLALRPVVVAAPPEAVRERLRAALPEPETDLTFFVQPASDAHCVIRGLLRTTAPGVARIDLLRQHHRALAAERDHLEARYADRPRPPYTPVFDQLPDELARLPERAERGEPARLRVRVARKWSTGAGIAGFELTAVNGMLPTPQPGAHLDVHLPTGDVRQYSVVNAPGESDRYVLGVKRETESRGGSACLHDVVREGDVLAISEPRNNFPLRRDAELTILVAGGIGVTPLLAMAQALHHQGLAYQFHYFAQSNAHLAFPERLACLGDAVRRHCGLDPERTQAELKEILDGYSPGRQLYVCGPAPLIEATRELAARAGWPGDRIHFEYFKNTNEIDKDSAFEVALSRSCLTLQVGPGQTILQAIREAGVSLPSSCEQGACGTCLAQVIEGEPVHQDVYLNEAEKAGGEVIITCVSRCSSRRLVLDL